MDILIMSLKEITQGSACFRDGIASSAGATPVVAKNGVYLATRERD